MRVIKNFILLILFAATLTANEKSTRYNTVLEYWPQTLLPSHYEDSSAAQLLTQTVGTLVRYVDNTISPYIATSWAISKDQTTYVFQLRKNGQFSNGIPITADEVILSFEESLKARRSEAMDLGIIKGAQAFHSGTALSIKGIKKINKYSISISLEKPFAPLLDILASPRFGILLHSDIVRLKKEKVAPFASSGPFVIISMIPNKTIILKPSPTYFEKNKTYLQNLTYDIISDPIIAQSGIESGKYHDIIPFSTKEVSRNKVTLKKISSLTAESDFLIFNLKHPQLKNKDLRSFISKSINVSGFLEKMEIQPNQRAFGLIPRGMLGHNPELSTIKISPISPKAFSDIENNPCNLSLIMYGEDNSPMRDALITLTAPLNKYKNIKLRTRMLPMEQYYKRVMSGDYEVALFRMKPDYRDTYMMLRYILNEKLFAPGFDRREIKFLISKARSSESLNKRAECYRKIDSILQTHRIIVPLFHGDRGHQEVVDKVHGLNIPFLGYLFREYRNVSLGN